MRKVAEQLEAIVAEMPPWVKSIVVDVETLRSALSVEGASSGIGPSGADISYLTTRQAATRLSVKPETVAAWCRRGKFPGARKTSGNGKRGEWRIPVSDVETFGQDSNRQRERIRFEKTG